MHDVQPTKVVRNNTKKEIHTRQKRKFIKSKNKRVCMHMYGNGPDEGRDQWR